jgi:hypothetical protein
MMIRSLFRRPRCTCAVCASVLVALIAVGQKALAADDKAPAGGEEKMSASWSRTEPVADPPDAKYGEWRFWVQDGWLMAERRTGEGEIEWKIVLAKVAGNEPPEITVNRPPRVAVTAHRRDANGVETATTSPAPTGPMPGGLRLSYRGGRYFIRDDFGSLRCQREEKTDDVPWPEMQLPPRDANAKLGRTYAPRLGNVISDGWIVVHAGPQRPTNDMVADCLLRLAHQDLQEPGGLKINDPLNYWFFRIRLSSVRSKTRRFFSSDFAA